MLSESDIGALVDCDGVRLCVSQCDYGHIMVPDVRGCAVSCALFLGRHPMESYTVSVFLVGRTLCRWTLAPHDYDGWRSLRVLDAG